MKLPLKVNVWRTGTLGAIYWARGSYGDQIKVVGSWEQEGQGHFYLPAVCIDAFTDAGLVAVAAPNAQGEPQFQIVNRAQRVGILRREEAAGDGRMRRVTEVVALDAAGNRVQLPPQARLQRPAQQAPAPASPAPPASVAPPAPAVAAPASGPPPAPVNPAPPSAPAQAPQVQEPEIDPAERARLAWLELSDRYAAALLIASQRLREQLGGDVGPEVIQAGAATVLISADRIQLRALPGVLRALRGDVPPTAPKPARTEAPPARASRAVRTTPKPAPEPAPAPVGDAFEDFDEIAPPGDDDDLPF
jgi:hypothetical protein